MLMNHISRFSDIFYVDATNEQTIQTDLKAIVPGDAKQSVDASLRWLSNQPDVNWLLYFDNADDVNLKLKRFFPPSGSGNILVTTRNRELRHHAVKDADANVKGMDPNDAINLLLHQARAERSVENTALAEAIVQVSFVVLLPVEASIPAHHDTGTPLFCAGCRPSWLFHSLPLVLKRLSRTLPARTRQLAAGRRDSGTGSI